MFGRARGHDATRAGSRPRTGYNGRATSKAPGHLCHGAISLSGIFRTTFPLESDNQDVRPVGGDADRPRGRCRSLSFGTSNVASRGAVGAEREHLRVRRDPSPAGGRRRAAPCTPVGDGLAAPLRRCDFALAAGRCRARRCACSRSRRCRCRRCPLTSDADGLANSSGAPEVPFVAELSHEVAVRRVLDDAALPVSVISTLPSGVSAMSRGPNSRTDRRDRPSPSVRLPAHAPLDDLRYRSASSFTTLWFHVSATNTCRHRRPRATTAGSSRYPSRSRQATETKLPAASYFAMRSLFVSAT